MRCKVEVPSCDLSTAFEVSPHSGFVIGRIDEATNYYPDLDLGICTGREKGISRRHAAVVSFHGSPHLIDLHSINGTILNGTTLPPDQPFALLADNLVRFGTLEVRMSVGVSSSS